MYASSLARVAAAVCAVCHEAGDDEALDLAGALVDLEDLGGGGMRKRKRGTRHTSHVTCLCITHELLHWVFAVESVPAKNLNGIDGSLHCVVT